MPFIPLQPPSGLDTDGLRKHGEDQDREIARAWTALEANITSLETDITALESTVVTYTAQTLTAGEKDQARQNISASPVLRGYLAGLTISTAGASATFGVAAGMATDSTVVYVMTLTSNYTKTTSAWAVGTAAGALDTGSINAAAWYHVYLIRRPDTGVVDVCISTSASAPTFGGAIPAAYTQFRRIGSLKTTASLWTKVVQKNDEFLWDVPPQDTTTTVGTTADLITLSVPTGVQVNAQIFGLSQNAVGNVFWAITSPDQADTLPSPSFFCGMTIGSATNTPYSMVVRTNTSAQVRRRASAATTLIYINTFGWIDRRGRED